LLVSVVCEWKLFCHNKWFAVTTAWQMTAVLLSYPALIIKKSGSLTYRLCAPPCESPGTLLHRSIPPLLQNLCVIWQTLPFLSYFLCCVAFIGSFRCTSCRLSRVSLCAVMEMKRVCRCVQRFQFLSHETLCPPISYCYWVSEVGKQTSVHTHARAHTHTHFYLIKNMYKEIMYDVFSVFALCCG
jgi:hypothetical protein